MTAEFARETALKMGRSGEEISSRMGFGICSGHAGLRSAGGGTNQFESSDHPVEEEVSRLDGGGKENIADISTAEPRKNPKTRARVGGSAGGACVERMCCRAKAKRILRQGLDAIWTGGSGRAGPGDGQPPNCGIPAGGWRM